MMHGILFAAAAIVALLEPAYSASYPCNNNYYVNSSDHLVHSPSCGSEQLHHTAHCRDGSESFSEHRRGTCSNHGGVDYWE